MNPKYLIILIILIVIIALGIFLFNRSSELEAITSFEECATAGYPVMESFPARCVAPDGRTFIQATPNGEIAPPVTTTGTTTPVTKACKPTGCSSQICSDEEVMTTCEFREEYACYAQAKCERQATGECGWTNTPTLQACLQAAN